jgi:hypothetical protein
MNALDGKTKMLKTFVLALMLALGLSVPVPQPQPTTPTFVIKTPIEQQHETAHRLRIYDIHGEAGFKVVVGGCSGTVIGPHAILTAQHCFANTNLVGLDMDVQPTQITSAILDGNDHVIYIVNRTFTQWSSVDENPLTVGEQIHYWGNPGQLDVYGYGYFKESIPFMEVDPSGTFIFQHFVMRVLHGDSGAGMFNDAGDIVAVVSMGDESANGYCLPLVFTQAQLNTAAGK